jgi:predicted transposase YdaD
VLTGWSIFANGRAIIDLVTTIMVYKFNNLTRDEVDAMLGIELTEMRAWVSPKGRGAFAGKMPHNQRLVSRIL